MIQFIQINFWKELSEKFNNQSEGRRLDLLAIDLAWLEEHVFDKIREKYQITIAGEKT